MRHLYLYVEGQTEQTFADVVLRPHLAQFQVYLMGAVLAEHSRSRGRRHAGGVSKYEPFRRGLLNLLKQHSRSNVTLSTMVDLYRLPRDFPGRDDTEKLRCDPLARVAGLERALASNIQAAPDRFVPYIQLHEYEALLFVDPMAMSFIYSEQASALGELQKIADHHPNPELINDGNETAPSKRILDHLPAYDKVVAGSQVAERIGLVALRAKCPHFHDWISRLEQLGQPLSSESPRE